MNTSAYVLDDLTLHQASLNGGPWYCPMQPATVPPFKSQFFPSATVIVTVEMRAGGKATLDGGWGQKLPELTFILTR